MAVRGLTELEAELIRQTRIARQAANFTQAEVAELLNIEQGRYKNYETIRPLPHELIPRFCLICHTSPNRLYGHKEREPGVPEPGPEPERPTPLRKTG